MDTLLTADLGNSRLKLALWAGDPAAPAPLASAVHAGSAAELAQFAARWLAARRAEGLRAGAGALSSVADVEASAALCAALSAGLADPVRWFSAPDAGVELAVAAPEEVGLDRRYAARAAFELVGGAALVVDVGTCLTVNAVDRGARGARFRGGAIAPGPRLLAEVLHTGTARLPLVEPVPGAPALGGRTREALAGGIARGLAGAARELVESVAGEAGLGAAPVVLTGGARGFLQAGARFTERVLHDDEHLVARGLCLALADALGALGAIGALGARARRSRS